MPAKASDGFTAGISFLPGASMTIDPPEGMKVSPVFAYRVGGTLSYPFSPTIAGTFDLGLENRGTQLRPENNSDVFSRTNVQYFYLTPGFNFSGFWLGLNLGVPLGGSVTSGDDDDSETEDLDEASEDRLEFLLEPRLGGIIPIVDDDFGVLSVHISGGFSINEMFEPVDLNLPPGFDEPDIGDYHMVSLYLGLSYQFAIPTSSQASGGME